MSFRCLKRMASEQVKDSSTKFGAINHENQKRLTEQNFTTGLFLQSQRAAKLKNVALQTNAGFTFAGLSRFCFSFSKNKNSKQRKEASEFPCRDKRDVLGL